MSEPIWTTIEILTPAAWPSDDIDPLIAPVRAVMWELEEQHEVVDGVRTSVLKGNANYGMAAFFAKGVEAFELLEERGIPYTVSDATQCDMQGGRRMFDGKQLHPSRPIDASGNIVMSANEWRDIVDSSLDVYEIVSRVDAYLADPPMSIDHLSLTPPKGPT